MADVAFIQRLDDTVAAAQSRSIVPSSRIIQEYLQLVLLAMGHHGVDDTMAFVFGQAAPESVKRFACIALLRLFAADERLLRIDESFRLRFLALCEQALDADLFRQLRLSEGDQNFKKETELLAAVAQAEAQADALVISVDIGDIQTLRQAVLKGFNGTVLRSFVVPFVARPLVAPARLKELFDVTEAYEQASAIDQLARYHGALDALTSYVADADGHGTSYSRRFLSRIASRLKTRVELRFAASPLNQKAVLTAQPTAKKYPLSQKDAQFAIRMTVCNLGPGFARDVTLEVVPGKNCRVEQAQMFLGELQPGQKLRDIRVPARLASPMPSLALTTTVRWSDLAGSRSEASSDHVVEGQRADIDWALLAEETPYTLNPVNKKDELAGRKTLLGKLASLCRTVPAVSTLLYGKRRVGKTSIVNALIDELKFPTDPRTVYIDLGEVIRPEADETVCHLGLRMAEEVAELLSTKASPAPVFTNSLAPLGDYLRSIEKIDKEFRVVFILDEFDTIPSELQRRGAIADAFFQTLRSLSGSRSASFILVGGENMQVIINNHGQSLNKFQTLQVDAFHRDHEWSDYSDLVRRPVAGWCEFTDDAVAELFDVSSGNPFFTKLVCAELMHLLVDSKDSHVTALEVYEGVRSLVPLIGANKFAHYWDDGLLDASRTPQQQALARRRTLLAFAEASQATGSVTLEGIATSAAAYDLPRADVEPELRDFERRGILRRSGNDWRITVKLFEHWLREKGVVDLISSVAEAGTQRAGREEQERLRVRPEEVVAVTRRWGTYRGRVVGPEDLRAWLGQFGNTVEQRLMFRLAEALRFYSGVMIEERLRASHHAVRAVLAKKPGRVKGPQKKNDLLVVFADEPGKSAAALARRYADANDLYHDAVFGLNDVGRVLRKRLPDLNAIVLVDDFAGTGDSACRQLASIAEVADRDLQEHKVDVFYVCVAGFRGAIRKIETKAEGLDLGVMVKFGEVLEDDEGPFAERSVVFGDPVERGAARDLAESWGRRIVKQWPLGFGDCSSLVVFEHRCPNTTLPVFWAEPKEGGFRALFPRM